MKKTGNTSNLFGLSLFSRRKEELLAHLEKDLILGEKPVLIFTPNPEQVVQTQERPDLRTYFNQADYLIPDGVGLLWASRLLASRVGTEPIVERIAGADLVEDLLRIAREKDWKVLLIGGRLYTPAETIPYKGMQLHWIEGYQDAKQPSQKEEEELNTLISSLKPDLVFVAFGAPWQEKWVVEHKSLLHKTGVRLAMVVGGSFDYLFGRVARAPRWVRQLNAEWLYRLARQPWRWKRQLRLVKFVGLVLRRLL